MRKIKKEIGRHILYFFIICLFIFVITYYDIGCPILRFVGIPCPTCGVTRAIVSLIKGDLRGYFSYHPLAVPLAVAVALMIHAQRLKHPKGIIFFSVSVAVVNLVLYIAKF